MLDCVQYLSDCWAEVAVYVGVAVRDKDGALWVRNRARYDGIDLCYALEDGLFEGFFEDREALDNCVIRYSGVYGPVFSRRSIGDTMEILYTTPL